MDETDLRDLNSLNSSVRNSQDYSTHLRTSDNSVDSETAIYRPLRDNVDHHYPVRNLMPIYIFLVIIMIIQFILVIYLKNTIDNLHLNTIGDLIIRTIIRFNNAGLDILNRTNVTLQNIDKTVNDFDNLIHGL